MFHCPICLSTDALPRVELACHHEFHSQCLGQWFTKNDSCPLCRGQVPRQVRRIHRARLRYEQCLQAHCQAKQAKLRLKKQYAIIRAKEERLALRLRLDAAVAKEENTRDDLRLAEKAWSKFGSHV